jgi:hypothetical protein
MDAIKVVRIALRVLTDRAVVLAGLAMSCVLAGWVMYEPAWERVAALAIFTVFGYFVVPNRESKHDDNSEG